MSPESDQPPRLLDPTALERIGNLSLRARTVVEGFVQGLHRSPYRGFSVEFAEHRAYTFGDEPRRVDWKVFGKTDRLFVKQYEEETNLRAMLLVDVSSSMGYASEGMVSKLGYASCLAASLAHLALRQGDAAGLVLFDQTIRHFLPPRSVPSQRSEIVTLLEEAVPAGDSNISGVLRGTAERMGRRGLFILLSDLFAEPADILDAIAYLRHRHHEVLVMAILDEAERTFPFTSWTQFRDVEAEHDRMLVDPGRVRRAYLDSLHAHFRQLRDGCRRHHADLAILSTATPYDEALVTCLALREGRRARLEK